ncbi:hypothetical protein [Myxococcus landrumensis]|uniref:Lipoprotein n=1 Tax=Myxococcus landrumensis TaxID=2813577 RepID=A0ABX7MYL6_9BACT|nr:hypothetical protein [Myxococcus landrumus]QSQ11550.1 hypothetical protein JY572_24455 [Myxococcus landrumus]
MLLGFGLPGCASTGQTTAVYRLDRDAHDIARTRCDEVASMAGGTPIARDTLNCDLAENVRTEFKTGGDVLRITAASSWRHTDIALKLGQLAEKHGVRIELVEMK